MELFELDMPEINWSLFGHTAQANYVHARISLQTAGFGLGVSLSHQMIELFCKAVVLHDELDSDWAQFQQLRREFSHDTVRLLSHYQDKIGVFDSLMNNQKEWEFISTVNDHYVASRFGQVGQRTISEDLFVLDRIFQKFSRAMYQSTKVPSLLFLAIPVGTEPFFDSSILDFSWPNCKRFGPFVGNIRILI